MLAKDLKRGQMALLDGVSHAGYEWVQVENIEDFNDDSVSISFYWEGHYLEIQYLKFAEVATRKHFTGIQK